MKNYPWLLVLILVSACSIFDGNNSSKIKLDGSWELVKFISSDGKELSLIDYEVHTLRFPGNMEISGEAACNYYGGDYLALENGKMTINELAVTEALCRQPSLGEEFVEALTRVKKFSRSEDELILFFGDKGKLTFSERLE